jgi:hypothetical protein
LPEAFNLGGFFKSLLPTIAGYGAAAAFPQYALMAGIAAGAGVGALTNKKDPLMGAAMGGLGGYGGYGIQDALKAAGTAGSQTIAADAAQGMTTKLAQSGVDMSNPIVRDSVTQELMRSGVGADDMANIMKFGPMTTDQANIAAQTAANVGKHGALTTPTAGTFGENLSTSFQGAKNLLSGDKAAWDATRAAIAGPGQAPAGNLSVATTFGMPFVGAGLQGLEYSDIYGEPMRPGQNPNERYDPSRSLTLNTDTGLRFEPYLNSYAQGGPVSFADGGDALKGGGSDALKGSDRLSLDVSDINAKYGYNPEADSRSSGSMSGMGMMGLNSFVRRPSMPSVEVPQLGLFADNDQIEAARTAYEQQLAAAMSGRGGMGAPYGMGSLSGASFGNNMMRGMGGMQNPNGGMNSMGALVSRGMGTTADTAPTAETALSRLNLNKNYANGGTIQSGGIQDLYGSRDDNMSGPALSRDGDGLGRLQSMAEGGMAYAKGGNVKTSADNYHFFGGGLAAGEKNDKTIVRMDPTSGRMYNNDFSQMYQSNPEAVFALLRNSLPKSLGGTGAQMRNYLDESLNSGGSSAMQGGNLNLNTASGLGYAKGGETRYTMDKNTLGGKMFGETGVIDQLPPNALAELLNNPGMRHFMGLRAVEEPKYYSASGAGMGGGDALSLGRSTGVNLNTASGLGMAKGGYLDGAGDGMSDSIPATIEGKQPARLADGEFVIPADVVSHLGNGSTKAGSKRLYAMLDKVRKARTGTKQQGKQIKPEKYMPA